MEGTLRLDYDYFLKRRNLTTHMIIINNNITQYSKFVELLKRLKVRPPQEDVFNAAMEGLKPIPGAVNEIKNEPNKEKKDARQPKPRRASRKGTAKSTTRRSRKPSPSTKDGNLPKT